jgi:hypothetical protein
VIRRALPILAAVALAAAGCGGDGEPTAAAKTAPVTMAAPTATPAPAPVATAPCRPAKVHQAPYPGHGRGLDELPWIAGTPRELGLVGLVWFFSPEQGTVRRARIWTHGTAPQGYNTKMLWVFLGRGARDRAGNELRVTGRRMDGPGRFSDSFVAVGYEGADDNPSYASIIDIPKPGCWRLTLTTGSLRATVDMRAVDR